VRQLAVLLPAEGHRADGVDHGHHRHRAQVENLGTML
jgi:hypothetical protein